MIISKKLFIRSTSKKGNDFDSYIIIAKALRFDEKGQNYHITISKRNRDHFDKNNTDIKLTPEDSIKTRIRDTHLNNFFSREKRKKLNYKGLDIEIFKVKKGTIKRFICEIHAPDKIPEGVYYIKYTIIPLDKKGWPHEKKCFDFWQRFDIESKEPLLKKEEKQIETLDQEEENIQLSIEKEDAEISELKQVIARINSKLYQYIQTITRLRHSHKPFFERNSLQEIINELVGLKKDIQNILSKHNPEKVLKIINNQLDKQLLGELRDMQKLIDFLEIHNRNIDSQIKTESKELLRIIKERNNYLQKLDNDLEKIENKKDILKSITGYIEEILVVLRKNSRKPIEDSIDEAEKTLNNLHKELSELTSFFFNISRWVKHIEGLDRRNNLIGRLNKLENDISRAKVIKLKAADDYDPYDRQTA